MNRKITRFALGAKCEARGASGSTAPAETAAPSACDNSDRIAGITIDPATSDRSIDRREVLGTTLMRILNTGGTGDSPVVRRASGSSYPQRGLRRKPWAGRPCHLKDTQST